MKPGYKQTDVGVIPEDWNVKTIGDIADVKTGPFGSALHESDYVADGTPIITVEHLGDLRVDHFNLPMVSNQDKSRLKAYSLKAGDIVFSRVGSIDRNALIRELENGWLFSGRLLRVRINNTKDYPRYLSYHFHSEPFKRRVRGVAVGQTMPSLNTQLLKGVSIVLPTKEEQRSIATVLSDMDALLRSLDQLIAKKRDLKQATMQQLLTGKKRLPGFGQGKGYQQTEIGVIPEDWNVKLLGDIFSLGNGFSFKSEYFSSNGPIVLTPGNFKLEGGLYFNNRNTKRYSGDFPESTVFENGNLLVVMTDLTPDCKLLGKPAFVDSEEKILHNQRIGKIRLLSDNFDKQFLYFTLLSSPYLKKIKDQATGSTVRHTSNKSIYSVSLPIPKQLEEQHAIANVLSDMDTELAALEQRRDKTRALKQGMMQELLTGRTRLL